MTRITTTVLMMVILMNGAATIMSVSGMNDDLGVEMATGVDDSVNQTVNELDGAFEPDVNVIESFISLAIAGARVFGLVIEGVFAAPTLIINILGGGQLVETVVAVVFAPMYMIATLELVTIAIGNETV